MRVLLMESPLCLVALVMGVHDLARTAVVEEDLEPGAVVKCLLPPGFVPDRSEKGHGLVPKRARHAFHRGLLGKIGLASHLVTGASIRIRFLFMTERGRQLV